MNPYVRLLYPGLGIHGRTDGFEMNACEGNMECTVPIMKYQGSAVTFYVALCSSYNLLSSTVTDESKLHVRV